MKNIYRDGVEILRAGKRGKTVFNSWFFVQEHKMRLMTEMRRENIAVETPAGQAELLCRLAQVIDLEIPAGSVFAGTQNVAFSPSYALINPSFKVETFGGYCDPCAMYGDVVTGEGLTAERVEKVRKFFESDVYAKNLYAHYQKFESDISEVVYFMEPVTGHTIPDLRPFLAEGVAAMQAKAGGEYGFAMRRSLDAVLILADRYAALAQVQAAKATDGDEKQRLAELAARLQRVPREGARNLPEAIQSFILLWQTMVLEQAPNPYAFSAGNIDRIFEPYVKEEAFDNAVAYFRHLLAFYLVGSRGWAISQNIMVGGRDCDGNDLTSDATYAVLAAFFESNDPQPALSAKIHRGTPDRFFAEIGRFFATPGHSTPSLFNDDAMFGLLAKDGIAAEDRQDYSIAGCQEPLIMGKSSYNTTNTWLNLGKILELALNDGCSTLTGKKLGPSYQELGFSGETEVFQNPMLAFDRMLGYFLPRMAAAGNGCTEILGRLRPVPLSSAFHDGFDSFRDMRDPEKPGTRYHHSGCLIHGLSVIADSFTALKSAVPQFGAAELRKALAADFKGYQKIRQYLLQLDKYGNNLAAADAMAVEVAKSVSLKVSQLRNNANNTYLADWSTPSTHLLYGYWVGATPDGRHSRTMLGYGIDPLPESTRGELSDRILSMRKLPYHLMTGGYASHIGIAQTGDSIDQVGFWMRDRVIRPLFHGQNEEESPFYVYFNLDTTKHLRKILADPGKYVPSGIYIMRIHGTFVNFLDLSPAIQEDIIERLEAHAV